MRLRSACLPLLSAMIACASDPAPIPPAPPPPEKQIDQGVLPAEPSPPPARPADEAGPPPAGCALDVDEDGFFVRDSGKSEYVGFVPKSYDGKPTRLLVGLHGCGDDARNFAEWGVSPYATRDTQDHIGVSVDGASGGDGCWAASDAEKVLAAIDDVARCLYVHRRKVVLGGFSSGGILAYSVGLANASRFAGLLVESSALPGGVDLSKAAWRLPIAHVAHTEDDVFPLAKVRKGWQKLRAAGFSVETAEVEGGHDGTTEDWAEWLLPRMTAWQAP